MRVRLTFWISLTCLLLLLPLLAYFPKLIWATPIPAAGLLYALPKFQTRGLLETNESERFRCENEARKTLAEILGAGILIAGLYLTWQASRRAEQAASAKLSGDLNIAENQIRAQFDIYRKQTDDQRAVALRQRQMELYSRLLGIRFAREQLYVSKLSADITALHQIGLWHLDGNQKDSVFLEEARTQLRRSEQLTLEVNRMNEGLLETIGGIQLSFRPTAQLRLLTKRVHDFKGIEVKDPKPNMSGRELDAWRQTAIEEVKKKADVEYARPLEGLAQYLSREIEGEDAGKGQSQAR